MDRCSRRWVGEKSSEFGKRNKRGENFTRTTPASSEENPEEKSVKAVVVEVVGSIEK